MPVSVTSKRTKHILGRLLGHRARMVTPPSLVNFIALPTMLVRILPHPSRVADDPVGNLGVDQAGQLDSLRVRGFGEQIQQVLHRAAQIEAEALQLDLPGFDLEKSRISLMSARRVSRRRRRFRRTPVVPGSSGVSESRAVMPITPLRGVRISWLIVARKRALRMDRDLRGVFGLSQAASVRKRLGDLVLQSAFGPLQLRLRLLALGDVTQDDQRGALSFILQ